MPSATRSPGVFATSLRDVPRQSPRAPEPWIIEEQGGDARRRRDDRVPAELPLPAGPRPRSEEPSRKQELPPPGSTVIVIPL